MQAKSPKRHEGKFGHISNLRWLSKESPENANHLTNNINKSHYTKQPSHNFLLDFVTIPPTLQTVPTSINEWFYILNHLWGSSKGRAVQCSLCLNTHPVFALWVHTLHSTLLTTRVGGADTPPCNLKSETSLSQTLQALSSTVVFPHKLPLSHKHRSQANMLLTDAVEPNVTSSFCGYIWNAMQCIWLER